MILRKRNQDEHAWIYCSPSLIKIAGLLLLASIWHVDENCRAEDLRLILFFVSMNIILHAWCKLHSNRWLVPIIGRFTLYIATGHRVLPHLIVIDSSMAAALRDSDYWNARTPIFRNRYKKLEISFSSWIANLFGKSDYWDTVLHCARITRLKVECVTQPCRLSRIQSHCPVRILSVEHCPSRSGGQAVWSQL